MADQRVNILVYRSDSTMVAQYLLGDGEHLIGRDINCPVYLDSEYISTQHAKLHLSHDGIHIEDLNSSSGTFLDGVTVRGKLRVKPGQLLQLGDLTVYLQPETEHQIGPGSRLGNGRYTLVRLLGKGGMGEVWLAKDEQLDEEVALKKLPHEVGSDAVALADMRREVQKSRALSHPNIIRIHDLIQQPGEDPLISLEFVDGTDLTAIAATKTNNIFDWADIRDWVLQLLNALEYAHEEKIVHRDLKPGNIMISRNGRLKLADFGIAASVADVTRRSSMAGFISGTTIYMSPQQMEGAAPKETDDIYAFGATIYELLTSRPPFYTGNVEHQVLNVTPTPPSQRLAEFGFMGQIPPYVQELLMACLAKDPSGRPQSMGLIRQWIETEGKAQDIIPKPTTKTIKHSVPVAAAPLPQGVGGKASDNESNYLWVYIAGAILVLVCFIVGKKMGGGKSAESSAVLPESLTQGLVAYYPFNGNAKDESGNGNDGEIIGAKLIKDRFGNSDSAFEFDGINDWIDLTKHNLPIAGSSPRTIGIWIKPRVNPRGYNALHTGVDTSRLGEADPDYRVAFHSSQAGNISIIAAPPHLKVGPKPDLFDRWSFHVFTYDGSSGSYYIDGILEAEEAMQLNTFDGKIYISKTPHNGDFYCGDLDDVFVFNRALSAGEVKALYEFEQAN